MLVAVRADRLADVAGHPASAGWSSGACTCVGALGEDGLRRRSRTCAAGRPGHRAGAGRPARARGGDDPGALPLLSHALVETWQRREGSTLTVAGYQRLRRDPRRGRAVGRAPLRRVDPGAGACCATSSCGSSRPGPTGEPVRTRVPRRLVATDADHEQLIELLVAARLVTSDDGVLEITHEALARAWPRLRGWLDDDVEGQRILHHLTGAADAWDTLGRPTASSTAASGSSGPWTGRSGPPPP